MPAAPIKPCLVLSKPALSCPQLPHTAPSPAPSLQLDGINLFAILSIISIFYCLPCALVVEGE